MPTLQYIIAKSFVDSNLCLIISPPGEKCGLEVLDRWLDPAHRYFKLRGDDNGIYILRQSIDEDHWEMILFDSGARANTRLSST